MVGLAETHCRERVDTASVEQLRNMTTNSPMFMRFQLSLMIEHSGRYGLSEHEMMREFTKYMPAPSMSEANNAPFIYNVTPLEIEKIETNATEEHLELAPWEKPDSRMYVRGEGGMLANDVSLFVGEGGLLAPDVC